MVATYTHELVGNVVHIIINGCNYGKLRYCYPIVRHGSLTATCQFAEERARELVEIINDPREYAAFCGSEGGINYLSLGKSNQLGVELRTANTDLARQLELAKLRQNALERQNREYRERIVRDCVNLLMIQRVLRRPVREVRHRVVPTIAKKHK